ncbi:MAG TPA: DUF1571 domain-containing protein [Pirellulales bacterium]|jgi:hypothetical protein|nr:DUF1571 domain-containing protein [Pirellulales bacterium]
MHSADSDGGNSYLSHDLTNNHENNGERPVMGSKQHRWTPALIRARSGRVAMAGLVALLAGLAAAAGARWLLSEIESDDEAAIDALSSDECCAMRLTTLEASDPASLTLAARLGREADASEHPLDPGMAWARDAMARLNEIRDYSCTLIKREWVDGQLLGPQRLAVKVRHEPFSVYLRYETPRALCGQEAIYVAGQNDNKLVGHLTGLKHRLLGAVSINPIGTAAMRGNRYPITEVGVRRMLERVVEVGECERAAGTCRVRYLDATTIDDRPASCLEMIHPEREPGVRYHLARVYVDDAIGLPVRFEAYSWPEQPGETPPLVEEYTYTNLVLNPGFDDRDFSPENPRYGFARGGADRLAQDERTVERTVAPGPSRSERRGEHPVIQ